MTQAAVHSLLDSVLPTAEQIAFAESGRVLGGYAGIGMPSLRVGEAPVFGPISYHRVRAANRLRRMITRTQLRAHYPLLRHSALEADPNALNDLGWWWLNGSRVPFDPVLARRLLKLAFVLGSGEAAFNLGEQAWFGKGTEVDRDLAISYYEQAFDQGILCAARALGRLYEEGVEGHPADHARAVHWYLKADPREDTDACLMLGCLLLDRVSPVYDQVAALYWLQWAAMKGCRVAAERLANLYVSAFEGPPDPDGQLHVFWRDHAIALGSSWARQLKRDALSEPAH